ncbi:MAG TPA: ThiF family adenylyltransferase, partial [Saprospiraceae bacterium]|nr:ThiF family adenylyltransferase [Saprospiraceae bacterium]
FDTIEESNLQRQVLFTTADVGKSKSETARERLLALNPEIEIEVHNTRFTSINALELVNKYEVIADGTDNFPTRYLVNDACVLADKVNVYASIFRFEGQVSVFNYALENGARGPNYRDIFPEPPPAGLVPNCAEGGVIGVLPGIIGSLQALEVIKILSGVGEPLAGKLFLFDGTDFSTRILKVTKNPDNKIEQLIDYEQFCGISQLNPESGIKEISPKELYQLKVENVDFQLLDVREAHEYEISNIDGKLIPLSSILDRAIEISRTRKVVVHCKGGVRSAKAITELENAFGFSNLYNLKGGILAYAKEVDDSVPVY